MQAPGIPNTMDIEELGNSYYETKNLWYIANVPLSMIDYENWDIHRYTKNKNIIKISRTVKPIILGDFNRTIGKYELTDGNHRCFCSNELGYTHIPAIIHNSINNSSFININITL